MPSTSKPGTSEAPGAEIPGHRPITMRDVAQRAGVSPASVSRVLHNDGTVRPHIRQAVEDAIEALNYASKPATHDGRAVQFKRIGLLIPDITNPYFPFLIKGITNIASMQGTEVVLCNAGNQPEAEQAHVKRLVASGADGIIHIPFTEQVDPAIKSLLEASFPFVFLDRELGLENTCSVTSNNEEGAYQAITYLLSLGHRDIVFLSGPAHLSTSVARVAGYRKGLAEFGVAEAPEHVIWSDTTLEGGYQETARLLASKVPFTAIFASNDMMAFGAWKALEENGLRVPDDVSIIGYDDVPFADYIALTTIAQPSYELGRNALMVLMDLINGLRKPPQKILLRDSLIIRRSCRRL